MTNRSSEHSNLSFSILLKNGNVVDAESGTVTQTDVGITDGVITFVGAADRATADVVIDCAGKMVVPGFVDSHTHIESSMVLPVTFGKAVLPWGTTTVIADPHGGLLCSKATLGAGLGGSDGGIRSAAEPWRMQRGFRILRGGHGSV